MKILGMLQTINKLFHEGKIFILFLLSSASFLLLEILSRYIILDGMMETIKSGLFCIVVISGVAVLLMVITACFNKIIEPRALKVKRERIVNNALSLLLSLSYDEKALMKYFYQSTINAIYIPFDNPVALALWNKGILQRITNVVFPRFPEKKSAIGKSCFLYQLMPEIIPLIKRNYEKLGLKDTADKFDFSPYQ